MNSKLIINRETPLSELKGVCVCFAGSKRNWLK